MTAEVERRHRLQQLGATPEGADARRAAHLVRRKREEVTAELLDVDRVVRCRLSRVDDHDRAAVVRPGRQPLDRVDRSERVRDEVVGDNLDVADAGDVVQGIKPKLAVVIQWDRFEGRAGSLGDVLPGNEVRVVLELGDDDDVAGAEVVEAPRVGDQVDALGRAVREDHLARRRCVDELRHLLACALVLRGCQLRERLHAAVHVGVRRLVEGAQLVEHLARLVRADRGVEIGERLAAHLLLEDRKIGAKPARVELRFRGYSHKVIVPLHQPSRR